MRGKTEVKLQNYILLFLLTIALVAQPLSASAEPTLETETGFIQTSAASPLPNSDNLTTLSDEELAGFSAGEIAVSLDEFLVQMEGNSASMFDIGISESAFAGAGGIFTTLQAVNSAVNMTLIVNIWLDGQGGI